MTVENRDLSNYDGAPITLYEFSRRSVPTISKVEVVTFWRYTSADRDFVLGDDTYTAAAISDDGVRQSGEATADQLTISMPYTAKIPQMFVGSPPSDPIYCIIRHAHAGETDAFIAWAGIVGGVSRPDDNISASILCNTVGATMDRSGLRLSWSRNCPHSLYDIECKADPTVFNVTGTISGLNGAVVVCAAIGTRSPPTFNGGFMEWIDEDGHAERRGIVEHAGSTVRVLGTTDKMSIGLSIWIFFGCDKLRQTCHDKFNNLPNHGGHAYMPDANPFSGSAIF